MYWYNHWVFNKSLNEYVLKHVYSIILPSNGKLNKTKIEKIHKLS